LFHVALLWIIIKGIETVIMFQCFKSILRFSFEVDLLSKPTKLRMASCEWEHCWVLKFVFVVGKYNKLFIFVSFKWQLDTFVFSRTSGCNLNWWIGVTGHMVRINKLEKANVVASPETLAFWYHSFMEILKNLNF